MPNNYWQELSSRIQSAFQGVGEDALATVYQDPVERAKQMWQAILGRGVLGGASPFLLRAMGNVIPRLIGQQTLEAVANKQDISSLDRVASYLSSHLTSPTFGLINTQQGRELMGKVLQQQKEYESAAQQAKASGSANPMNNLAIALLNREDGADYIRLLLQASLPLGYGGVFGPSINRYLNELMAASEAESLQEQPRPWSAMIEEMFGRLR